jgi:hypothetical protein
MDYCQACIDKTSQVFILFYHSEKNSMKKSTEKTGELQAGMKNLSGAGKDYIKNMVRAMVSYQNSLAPPGGTGQPGGAKNAPAAGTRSAEDSPPEAGETEGSD